MNTQKIIASFLVVAFFLVGVSVTQAETPALDKMVAPEKPSMMPKPFGTAIGMVPAKDKPISTGIGAEVNAELGAGVSGSQPVKAGMERGETPEAHRARVAALIEDHKADIAQRQDAMQEKLEEHKALLAKRFGEKKAGEIIQVRERVSEQFGEVLLKLRSVEEKISSLLAMLEERNLDSATQVTLLEKASADIEAAETAIAALQDVAATDTEGATSVKDAGARARNAVEKAKQSTLAAFTSLRSLIDTGAHVEADAKVDASN